MCGTAADDPTQYDQPKVTAPRVYELSGTRRPTVALAILGEMLNDAEYAAEAGAWPLSNTVQILREARDRVAEAER